MKRSGECRVGIGDICLSISSDDLNFIKYFRDYYHHSLTEKFPDFSVRIDIQDTITRDAIPRSLDDYRKETHPIKEGNFSLYDNLISGRIHEEMKSCELKVEMSVIGSEYLPLFQDVVFRDLFYYLIGKKYKNGHKRSFIIHGCGVIHKGEGFLFVGPSGCGKSTIAHLSKKDTVLHDEAILLSENHDHYTIESTPYLSDITDLRNRKSTLKTGFFPKHGENNKIVNISKSKLVAQFVKQIVPPSGSHKISQGGRLSEMLSFSCRVIDDIPFFELYFSPDDDSFWKAIENITPASLEHAEAQRAEVGGQEGTEVGKR